MTDICSICLESNFVDSNTDDKRKYITKCNHIYHYDCIYTWVQRNNSCPSCRTNNLFENITEYYNEPIDNPDSLDNILLSINTVRLNLGNFVNDYNTDEYDDINIYLDNLTELFSNYYYTQLQQNNTQEIVYNTPNPNTQTQNTPINLQMSLNNNRRRRTNHRLGNMNFLTSN